VPRYSGLDLHKTYIHGCEFIPTAPPRQKERHFQFPNTSQGWSWLLNQVDRTCKVALEVTGSAFEAYDRLSPHVDQVLLANVRELKRYGSGRHTDRLDAARLVKLLALDALPTVWVPPLAMREVRRLLHCRERLARGRRRFINQAKVIFRRHGIMLAVNADVRHAAAQRDLTLVPLADRVILASALRQLSVLDAELYALETEIAARVHAVPQVRQLLTITNVGLIAAAAIWAGLGDPHRFTNPKQISRYAGLDPSIVQSGEDLRHGRISKNGNTLLRTVLVEAATGLDRHDRGPLGDFFRRKRTKLGYKKAVVALARKLLIVAWRMLLTGEPYRAIKPRPTARKHQIVDRLAQQRPPLGTMLGTTALAAECIIRGAQLRHRRTPVPA
jgi:transposase